MAKVKNTGSEMAYLPTDGGTVALEAGETSGELRLGDADYAVRNVPAVVWVDDAVTVQGVTKASIGAAVVPISEHEKEHPDDRRYTVAGDFVGSGVTPVVIPGPVVAPGTTDGVTPVGVEAGTDPSAEPDPDTAERDAAAVEAARASAEQEAATQAAADAAKAKPAARGKA